MATSPYSGYDPNGGEPTAQATDAAGTTGQTDSNTTFGGPLGYAYDASQGKAGSAWNYLDPGDFFGKRAGADVLQAGKEASARLQALSEQAWQRQMGGLQLALGSMNNYNGVLSNLYGVPTNHYDPRGSGGTLGTPPGGGASGGPPGGGGPDPSHPGFAATPPAPPPPPGGYGAWAAAGNQPAAPPRGGGTAIAPGAPSGGTGVQIPGPQPAAPPPPPGGYTDPILAKIAQMLQAGGPGLETRSGGGHF